MPEEKTYNDQGIKLKYYEAKTEINDDGILMAALGAVCYGPEYIGWVI